jgi:O-acetyl-ADP-ribose deacetylase
MTNSHEIKIEISGATMELVQGDITEQETDAIVNAANSSLLGGGGVDGAIHRAAGPKLKQETRYLGGCETGDAKISGGYRLKAKHVIHTVGPVYRHDDPKVPELLASAYRRSLEVAQANSVKTIAFPAISTGVYGYPMKEAATIALNTTFDFLRKHTGIDRVRFVMFTQDDLRIFQNVLAKIEADQDSAP